MNRKRTLPPAAVARFSGIAGLATVVIACLLPASAGASVLTSSTYQCTIDVAGPTHDCTAGIINITSSSGNQRVASINLAPSWLRLDAFVDVCNPTNWWIHLADSPTTNGFGGDAGTAEHQAEAYNLGTAFHFYGMDNIPLGISDPVYLSDAVAPASGCFRVQYTIYEDQVLWDDDGNPTDAARIDFHSVRGFESAPYAEADSEDPTSANANLWYLGINRTVGDVSRNGTGTNKVCLVLSTSTAPSTTALAALCP